VHTTCRFSRDSNPPSKGSASPVPVRGSDPIFSHKRKVNNVTDLGVSSESPLKVETRLLLNIKSIFCRKGGEKERGRGGGKGGGDEEERGGGGGGKRRRRKTEENKTLVRFFFLNFKCLLL
jgi:hypothetical protein